MGSRSWQLVELLGKIDLFLGSDSGDGDKNDNQLYGCLGLRRVTLP